MANKKKTYKFPKYAPGGEFGNFVKNGALAYGDALGGAVGLSNIVTEDDYSGKSAGTFSKIGDTGGQIAGAVLPYALQAAGVPAPATKAAQGIIGGFNPQDPNAQQVPQQSQGMDPNKIAGMAQTGMQIYNMGSQMGAFRNGGMMKYPDSGLLPKSNTVDRFDPKNYGNMPINKSKKPSVDWDAPLTKEQQVYWDKENPGIKIEDVPSPYQLPLEGVPQNQYFIDNATRQGTTMPLTPLKPLMSAPTYKNGGMQYTNGGINAEVEGNETSISGNNFTEYEGANHSNGGVKTHLDAGERVFTKRFGPNGTKGPSYAKLSEKYGKVIDQANELIKRGKLTKEALEANNLNLTAAHKVIDNLFNSQESDKVNKFTKYAKRIGLSLDGKYPNGGMNPKQWNDQYKAKGWQVDPRPNMATGSNGRASQYPAYYDPNTVKIVANPAHETGYDVTGLAPDNSNYATYQSPINKVAIDTPVPPQYIPQGQTTYQGKPAGYFRQGSPAPGTENDRFVFAGGQYVKMSNGGYMPKYTGGGYGPIDERRDVPAVDRGMYLTDRSSFNNAGDDRMGAMGADPMDNGMQGGGPNWGAIGTQAALGLANNVGNIYDLSRANKVENTKFDRMTPSNLDPTAALNYNMVQGRKLNEDIRNASGGNASNYIQNRKDAAINQMMSNAQIRQSYANQNAGINNQAGMFNTGIANQEVVANEQNRAASRNLKSQAYSNIGQNIMGQYKDTRLESRDQDMLDIIEQQYPEAKYNPALKNYYTKKRK